MISMFSSGRNNIMINVFVCGVRKSILISSHNFLKKKKLFNKNLDKLKKKFF